MHVITLSIFSYCVLCKHIVFLFFLLRDHLKHSFWEILGKCGGKWKIPLAYLKAPVPFINCLINVIVFFFYKCIYLHPASVMGVIVLTSSVCLSVTTLAGEWSDGLAWFLAWRWQWKNIKVKYIGKVIGQRSRSLGPKKALMGISMEWPLKMMTSSMEMPTEEYDCTDMMRGFFKACVVTLVYAIAAPLQSWDFHPHTISSCGQAPCCGSRYRFHYTILQNKS